MGSKFLNNEKGFTGLEAAIVLIAFVVVAAVFSYVMLSAGFFTTQKSQEVVHTGVTQASSSIALSGDVIVGALAAGGAVDTVTIYVTNTAGGTPVDLDKTVISYTDNDNFINRGHGAAGSATLANGWQYTGIIHNDGAAADNLLEAGEKYRIEVTLNTLGTVAPATVPVFTAPGVNEKIKFEIKPPEGAVLVLQKTMPPALSASNYYPVY